MVWPLAQRVVCQKIPTLVLSELVAVVGVIASRPWSGALECGERQGRQVVGGADRGTSGSVSVHRPGLDGAGRVVPWLPRRRMVNADGMTIPPAGRLPGSAELGRCVNRKWIGS